MSLLEHYEEVVGRHEIERLRHVAADTSRHLAGCAGEALIVGMIVGTAKAQAPIFG